MKLIYSGNASKSLVEYSTDEGSTFVPVTLADLKNGVELSTNDLSKIQVRAGNKTITDIDVLKKFKVVEQGHIVLNVDVVNELTSGTHLNSFSILENSNNFEKDSTDYAILLGNNKFIKLYFDGHSFKLDSDNIKIYETNDFNYEDSISLSDLYNNYLKNNDYVIYDCDEWDDGDDSSNTFEGSFSKVFTDSGYALHFNEYKYIELD